MEKNIAFKDSHISYRVEGTGATIILVHGFGEDSHIWDKQLSDLKMKYQVIVPDLPGSGKSTLLNAPIVKISDYSDCLYNLLQLENVSKCTMIGHSMGGYITLAFAEKFPAMLNGFGWINSTAFADSEEKKQTRIKGISMMQEYGAFPFLKNTIPNLFAERFKLTNASIVNELIEKAYTFNADSLIQYYNAMITRPDRTHVLKASQVPVLIVAGDEDIAAPLDDVLKQSHLPDVCNFHLLKGVGHIAMLEDGDKVNKFVEQYLESIY